MRRPLLAAAAILLLSAATLLIPNPQDAVLQNILVFEDRMNEAAKEVEAEAEKSRSELSEKDLAELRRLLADLSRKLRSSDNAMETMLAINEAEERLEALRDRMAGDAMNQLAQTLDMHGMETLAESLETDDAQSLQDAMSSADAVAMKSAAEQFEGEMQNLLNAAAQAFSNGDTSAALSNLSQLQSAARSDAAAQLNSASQLLSALQAAAGSSGQGQSGQPGQGGQGTQSVSSKGGNGAGQGSTNEDHSSSREENSGRSGNADPHYREGLYESIYDPTRTDASQTDLSAQSPKGEGESTQAQLGPGAGAIGGSVPYNQVVFEYAEAAVQAAESQNLTAEERSWVNSYFASLTEQ